MAEKKKTTVGTYNFDGMKGSVDLKGRVSVSKKSR